MKITHKTVILTLAAISLLVVPALSDRGIAGIHHGGWMLLVDDLTEEELGSMTLAEIKDLKDQKMQELQNMTPAEIRELREQKCEQARQELENMTISELRDMRQNRAFKCRNGWGFGPAFEFGFCDRQSGCQRGGFAGHQAGMWMLLVDEATRENLQNMTLDEIEELKQQKMAELEDMTLAEIKELRAQKIQELESMTLAELKEQRSQMGRWGGPFTGPRCAMNCGFQDDKGWDGRDMA